MSRQQYPLITQRLNPAEILPLHSPLEQFFDAISERWSNLSDGLKLELKETADGVELSAELPGIAAKDVEISLDEGVVTIRGEKREESDKREGDYRIAERRYGSFSRSVRLPGEVDASRIKASMADGVLTVTAPKLPGTTAKRIAIEVHDNSDHR